MTQLVQILLPLRDNNGRRFPRAHFAGVRNELVSRFGGLTAYARSPAHGLWKSSGGTKRDDVVVFEVMTSRVGKRWWSRYRRKLERRFRQDEIVVRAQSITLL
jgi:hypothetical protein